MKKAELVIESTPDDNFLVASCSMCPTSRFQLHGNDLRQKEALPTMFDMHVQRKHSDQISDTRILHSSRS